MRALRIMAAGFAAASLVAVSGVVANPAAAAAPTAGIYPYSQSGPSGTYFTWGGAWDGTAPYTVTFYYGDGAHTTLTNTHATSYGYGKTLVSCTGQTYTEHLHVVDHTGQTADAYAYTTVARGNQCFGANRDTQPTA